MANGSPLLLGFVHGSTRRLLPCWKRLGRILAGGTFLGVLPVAVMNAQTMAPTTVDQAVFRSRWVGEPADQMAVPPALYVQEQRDMSLGSFLRSLRESAMKTPDGPGGMGLRLGPVDVHPGVTLGWEFSNENGGAQSQKSTGSDNNSFFIAPSLTAAYFREVGAWTVDARYSGSYTFYTNRNYNNANSGAQNNPFQQTGSLQIGVEGSRYRIQGSVGLAYGSGFDVESGENNTELSWNSSLMADYQLTEKAHIGANLSASQNLISQTENSSTGTLGSYEGTAYTDYAWTGKTRLRFEVGAGRDTQGLNSGGGGDQARSFGQSLVSVIYDPTSKLNFEVGVGARYVTGSGSGVAEEVGFRPAYRVRASYQPTEKLTLSASFGSEGVDVRPTFSLGVSWQPRLNTALSLSLYQNQGYSSVLTSQIRVSRGVVGSISQTLFSRAQITLSAGYEQWRYINANNDAEDESSNQNTSQGYFFASGGFSYRFQDWLIFNSLLWVGNDRQGGEGSSSSPEVRATLGLTFIY